MAVKLRLMRMGKKKQPTYRIVAADSRSPRNGLVTSTLVDTACGRAHRALSFFGLKYSL